MTTTTGTESADTALTSTNAKPRKRRSKADKSSPSVYSEFMTRSIKAFGRKISAGDVAALPELIKMQDLLDETVLNAVGQLISDPQFEYSWAEVADALTAGGYKISRQGVQQKYGKRLAAKGIKPARRVGGQPAARR
jgi:hypothetical protein